MALHEPVLFIGNMYVLLFNVGVNMDVTRDRYYNKYIQRKRL